MNQDARALGKVRHSFRPKMTNIAAGAIIGIGLVVLGIIILFGIGRKPNRKPIVDTSDRIAEYAIIGMMGVLPPLGGIALLVWMKRLASHRVDICENGFSYTYRGDTRSCPWTEVKVINEIFTQERLQVLKVPGAAIKTVDRSFLVTRNDGEHFSFSVNSNNSILQLAQFLTEARDKYSIPWQRVEQ